ncbi:protein adenylyltransferase SelO [Phenylobacterium sp. J367]|uniref:protein adenylyltransferase SelO n=1 Tax=Phenylobacterium sp. J367 TaxID=2898435 RepID=UPI0021514251|nr:YdiU family protein [Phenylobacterium sp. J367]MCR5877333.1 YdiU family protein [Phenylobacterium sp. J367]
MPVSPAYRPDPRFPELGAEFADPVHAEAFPKTILRFRNDRAAASIGLDTLTDDEWVAHFGRFEPLPGNIDPPLAQRYHGHQFQVYNPELGDGRGFVFAQMREAGTDRLLDLGTKGSGRTPWSRSGDGRLTLKGGVREVLATALLEALGVPTSRSFSLVETGEELVRGDEPSPTRSAVLTRLSHSHIRFGTFQRHAFFERADRITALIDHVIAVYYPELAEAADKPTALLTAVSERMARLTARWMAAGFVHGVLNTDNMSLTGESFDYGPYRFLPKSDPNFTAAYFDHAGLYAFGRQPEAVFWNLQQLAGALTLVAETDPLVDALNVFGPAYRRELVAAMLLRLGVKPREAEADAALAQAAFKALAEGGEAVRWEPFFFDWFGGGADRALAGRRAETYRGGDFDEFRMLIGPYEAERPERLAHPYFAQPEPEELLYDEIEAIWAPIAAQDDWAAFEAKLARIETARVAWGLPAQGT